MPRSNAWKATETGLRQPERRCWEGRPGGPSEKQPWRLQRGGREGGRGLLHPFPILSLALSKLPLPQPPLLPPPRKIRTAFKAAAQPSPGNRCVLPALTASRGPIADHRGPRTGGGGGRPHNATAWKVPGCQLRVFSSLPRHGVPPVQRLIQPTRSNPSSAVSDPGTRWVVMVVQSLSRV